MRKIMCVILLVLLFPKNVYAGQSEEYIEEMTDYIDFSSLDNFMEHEKVTFSGLVETLLYDGIEQFDKKLVFQWAKDALFYEIEANKTMLVEIVLLAIAFSILKNFAGAFRYSYISDLCFILVYCVLAVMLLKSFVMLGDIASQALLDSVEFMKMLIPTFCITMVFSAGVQTSAGFYQMAFLVIYLIQWLFLNLLVPAIHIYVLLELMNHFMEDEKFINLTELLKGAICWGMKLSGIVILGLNVVQGLVNPAKDRLMHGTLGKAAAMLPGVGNAVNGMSELLLGSGIVIKNCVGVAALLVLAVIGMIPMLKIGCLAFFYKLAAAVAEPVTDKRIAGCLKGMAEGGVLYLKLMGYCLILFFVTIALTTAVSGFIY